MTNNGISEPDLDHFYNVPFEPAAAARRRSGIIICYISALIILFGCSEKSLEGVDLTPPASSDQPSVETSAVWNDVVDDIASVTTERPTTTIAAPNPDDLGRELLDGVFYVGPNGSDQNGGQLPSTAFGSLNHAISILEAGDQLLILEGDYDEEFRSDTSVFIGVKGTPEAWIRIGAFPDHDVVVRGSERNAFKFRDAEYVELSDLQLIGSGTDLLGAGIHVETDSHHIRILRNRVQGFPAGGINVTGSSHILIANNEVFGNAGFHPGQHSGISIWRPANLGYDDDGNGYSNYVVGNTVYENRNTVSGEQGITDGNCVILDQQLLTGYSGRTLIANNVCFNNGGRGVNIHESSRADVVNNTLFHNLTTPELVDGNAELMAYGSSDVRFINNLVVPSEGRTPAQSSRSNDIIFVDNLFVALDANVGGENTTVDPSLIDKVLAIPSIDPSSNDLSLSDGSIAIDLGRPDFAEILLVDRNGDPRLQGSAVDIGAYER